MLYVKVLFTPKRLPKNLAPHTHIIGMKSLEYPLEGQLTRSIELKDSIALLRPRYRAVHWVPSKTAGVAQSLCLGQVGIRVPQVRVQAGILESGSGLGC